MFRIRKFKEKIFDAGGDLDEVDIRAGVKVLKYKRKRELKEPAFGGKRWNARQLEKIAIKEGRIPDQNFKKVGSGGVTVKYAKHQKVVLKTRAYETNPLVQKLIKDAKIKQVTKEELEEIEVSAGDFLEWTRRIVRSKKFKGMMIRAAKTDNKVLLKLAEFAVGKPTQSLTPPVGNGKMIIAWETEEKKILTEKAGESVIDVPVIEEALP